VYIPVEHILPSISLIHWCDIDVVCTNIQAIGPAPLQVNWDDERECFRDLCKECSAFYSIRKQYILEAAPPGDEQENVRRQTHPPGPPVPMLFSA